MKHHIIQKASQATRLYRTLSILACFIMPISAYAALPDHKQAPDFTLKATQGGKILTYHLQDALKHGPVVLYFYPAAFTTNCTIEAHEFAEAVPDYQKLGATLIGVSMDPLAKLQKFSVSECRNAFPVAADPTGRVTTLYDAKMPHQNMANRTSYVISPKGEILMSYTNNDPDEHVSRTLNAIKMLLQKEPAPTKK